MLRRNGVGSDDGRGSEVSVSCRAASDQPEDLAAGGAALGRFADRSALCYPDREGGGRTISSIDSRSVTRAWGCIDRVGCCLSATRAKCSCSSSSSDSTSGFSTSTTFTTSGSPIFKSIPPGVKAAPRTLGKKGTPCPAEHGYLHCGPSGAGHFVKMVDNGIEYGLMTAYAEGLNILRNANAGKRGCRSGAAAEPGVLPI